MPGANLKKSFCSLKEENLKVLASKLGLEIASGDTLLLFCQGHLGVSGAGKLHLSRKAMMFNEQTLAEAMPGLI